MQDEPGSAVLVRPVAAHADAWGVSACVVLAPSLNLSILSSACVCFGGLFRFLRSMKSLKTHFSIRVRV